MKTNDRVKVVKILEDEVSGDADANDKHYIGMEGTIVIAGGNSSICEMSEVRFDNGEYDAFWNEELEVLS